MGNISFKYFDYNDNYDSRFLRIISMDKDISKRLNITSGDKFIIKLNKKYIGILVLNNVFYAHNSLSVSIGILREYRNLGIGTRALEVFAGEMLKNESVDSLFLDVKDDNEVMKRVANKAGFIQDYSVTEMFLKENYGYIPFRMDKKKKHMLKKERKDDDV